MKLHDQMFLVPIKVKALVVGKHKEKIFAGSTVNFGAFQSKGQQIQTEPFTLSNNLEAGVHLHWFLPECLVHGEKDAQDTQVTYPNLPDRWIVTRAEIRRSAYPERKIVCRCFVVESNFVSNQRISPYNDGSILVPTEQGYQFLGRSGEYGRLPVGTTYAEKLTAAGYGEPGFYAYYPNCRNVFGFYDEMDGVDLQSSLFYHICGWYNKRDQDPVAGLAGEELADTMRRLGFAFSRSVPKKSDLFWNPQGDGNALLFHGTCYGITWSGNTKVYESGIPKEMPKIAIGNTSLEAFAALVANQTGKMKKSSERLLNAFLGDLMEEWAELDGVIHVEERIHQDTLQPVEGGVQWNLKKRENIDQVAPLVRRQLEASLEKLNSREKSREIKKGNLAHLQKETYFAWYRYYVNSKPRNKEMALEQWKNHLERLLLLDHELKLETDLVKQQIEDLAKEAEAYYELHSVPGERFWVPCEPVLLFYGDGVQQDYGTASRDEKQSMLTIRTFAQLITSIPVPGGEEEKRMKADYLWSYVYLSVNLPEPVKRLLKEALILSPECAAITAYEAMMLRGKEATSEAYRKMQSEIRKLITTPWQSAKEKAMEASVMEAEKLGYDGILPDRTGVTYYYPPWNLMYMEWEFTYMPDTSENLKNWELEEIDYRLKEVLPLTATSTYQGRMVLTPHMMRSLADTVAKYREKHASEKTDELLQSYEDMIKEFGKCEILSQRLSGFYMNFLTQRYAIRNHLRELWRKDPVIRNQVGEIFSQWKVSPEDQNRILDEMDRAADTEPYISDIFSPMRMGSAQLNQLRFIDSFGQVKKLVEKNEFVRRAELYISEQMDSHLYQNTIVLTPRLLQPAKLSFNWIKQAGEIIFGWLVPNYIDSSLMVFDETGKLAGTFMEVEDQAGNGFVKCLSPDGLVVNLTDVRVNPRLSEFMRSFGYRMQEKKNENFRSLRHFVGFLSDELSGMNLPGMDFQKNIMHFIGRPLALADVQIQVETHSPLLKRQTWTGEGSSNVLENFQVALRLGDQRKRSDGLVGFFRKDLEKSTDYSQFYAYGSNQDDLGYIRFNNQITLPINNWVCQTLLFDPTQVIHLISGMFPVYQTRLPEAETQGALERLNLEMLMNPLLVGGRELQLPLAVIPGKRWSFFTQEEGERFPVPSNQFAFTEEYPLKLLEGFIRLTKEEEDLQHGE